MSDFINVSLDGMGGDYAPVETVKGAVEAVNESSKIRVYVTGNEDIINSELSKYQYNKEQIVVVPTTEIIETAEPPVLAIRRKKDSSLVKALNLVKDGTCAGYVSAGSTGATLVGGQAVVGRLRGVDRSPLAVLLPTIDGIVLLIDCGANVDARSNHLLQFAKMGTVYMESIVGIKNPRVGILNVGAEEDKGNALVKETFPLLKNCPDINFTGSIEARDVPFGQADIVVCDAFAGNVLLKTYEGVADAVIKKIKGAMMKSVKTKLGALLIKKDLKETMKDFSVEEYGGAPMLGLKGLVIKTHGNSKSIEIKNSILQCIAFTEQNINQKIKEKLSLEDN